MNVFVCCLRKCSCDCDVCRNSTESDAVAARHCRIAAVNFVMVVVFRHCWIGFQVESDCFIVILKKNIEKKLKTLLQLYTNTLIEHVVFVTRMYNIRIAQFTFETCFLQTTQLTKSLSRANAGYLL